MYTHTVMGSLSGSGSGTLELYSAHFIDTYSEDHKLIVSDGPNEDTAAKWWQMVWDEDAAYIVMLTPQDVEDVSDVCVGVHVVCMCVCGGGGGGDFHGVQLRLG